MTLSDPAAGGLSHVVDGCPPKLLAALTDPERDPALRLPEFATDVARPEAPPPSVADIAEALAADVRGEGSAQAFIEALLDPFGSQLRPNLMPGQGQVRPSYEIDIDAINFMIPRAGVTRVAEVLHEMASRIRMHPVGPWAPEGAPVFKLRLAGHSAWVTEVDVAAPDPETARRAFAAAFGPRISATLVPLPITAPDLVPHVLAAREILRTQSLGRDKARQDALALISAVEDLRATATTILRANPDAHSWLRYWIRILPGRDPQIEISDSNDHRSSAHERIAFEVSHRSLVNALITVMKRYDILGHLPSDWEICLNGEPSFMGVDIKGSMTAAATNRTLIDHGLLEYARLSELAEKLEFAHHSSPSRDASWILHLSGRGRHYSKRTWQITGPTLAHAFARAFREEDTRSSLVLSALLSDLLADQCGSSTEIDLYRVLD